MHSSGALGDRHTHAHAYCGAPHLANIIAVLGNHATCKGHSEALDELYRELTLIVEALLLPGNAESK